MSQFDEVLARAMDEQDPEIEPSNDAADLLIDLALVFARLESCIADSTSPFTEENTRKILRHVVKAGDKIINIQEPQLTCRVSITLQKLEELS